ncbi:MAG: RNA polymerase sigma factor [Leptolinea sp.]|jgi:RNA polymerase sigma-70 factor (ECF subfamily)|nr:RNA polymerase sigma factor [Leptolinea sp.]
MNAQTGVWKKSPLPAFLGRLIRLFFHDTSTELSEEEEKRLTQDAIQDPQAFDALYRRYVDRVYAFHLVRTNSREEAEDLTSQTFLAALEGIASYRRQSSFPVWLFSIARRKLIDHYRRPVNMPLEMVDEMNAGLEETVDHRLQLQQVSSALARIDRERGEALSLRIFGQLNTTEISHLLSKSEGAVRNLVYRALQDLRRYLEIEKEMEEK